MQYAVSNINFGTLETYSGEQSVDRQYERGYNKTMMESISVPRSISPLVPQTSAVFNSSITARRRHSTCSELPVLTVTYKMDVLDSEQLHVFTMPIRDRYNQKLDELTIVMTSIMKCV